MSIWIQVFIFLLTNLPGIIKSIKDLIGMFGGDRKVARLLLAELHAVTAKDPGKRRQLIKAIIDKYVDGAGAHG